jgi:hypothetical protein
MLYKFVQTPQGGALSTSSILARERTAIGTQIDGRACAAEPMKA